MNTKLRDYVVGLLESYRFDVRKRDLLRFELAHSRDISDAEVLETMALAKGDSIGTSSGYISDKTFYIAVNYQEKAERLNQEKATSISEELVPLEQKLSRLEYCVGQLLQSQAAVIRSLYFEKKDLKSLALEMHISERTVQRHRDSAVSELVSMYETLQKAGVKLE